MRHPAVLRRIIAYLQETLKYLFPWLVRDLKTFEILESKRHRASVPTRHGAADLLTLLAVCGFLVVLILVSIRSPKDGDEELEEQEEEGGEGEEEDREDRSQNNANETVTESSIEGSMYSLPLDLPDPKDSNPVRHDCGDHSSSDIQHSYHHHDDDLSTVNFAARDFLNFPDILDVQDPGVSVRETASFSPQLLQRNNPGGRKVCGRRPRQQPQGDWFIRRTRSGHVYGKYPL